MDEKKLLDQIRQAASDLTPPESLNPDAIEKLLTQQKPARKKFFTLYRLAGTAAVFALCAVSFWQVQKIQRYSSDLEQKMTESIVSREADAGDSASVTTDSSSSDSSADNSSPDSSADNVSVTAGSGISDEDASDKAGTKENPRSSIENAAEENIPAEADPAETSRPAADSADLSVLPTARSYEEVYTALREKFYYDDAAYDLDMGFTASIASTTADTAGIEEDGAAVYSVEDSAPAEIAGFTADGSAGTASAEMSADGSAGTASAEMSADGSAGTASAEISADSGTGTASAEISADTSAETASADSGAGANSEEMPEEEVFEEDAAADSSAASEISSDYSRTNIQEFGVDEADIVKTDGQYFYILRRSGSVTIVDARDPNALKEASTIPPADPGLLGSNELYVDGDILNVIAIRQSTSLEQSGDVYYPSSSRQTMLYTYDISDRTDPKLSGTVSQDGSYETSRKNGSFIYLFTSWYPDLGATYQESRIVPSVNGTDLKVSDFYIPESLTSSSYLLISSVNIEDPQNILDRKALVSGTSNFYVSPENIYIANENWNSDAAMTDIMKFHYEDGRITGTAAGSVKGYLNNSFSLNEYNGFLRAVSTYYDADYEEQNGLYILDDMLNITGSIEDLAEGETIRSARFFGDIGYFVTFRQTDPLFSVDLSDPAAPAVLGELKVSGFSSYLHFYGENLLLGMGYEADEETGVTSGVKLSMFDVSDPANVTELHRLVIPGVTWCPSIDNYKSILIDPQKNIFGFFCGERYLVFSYNKEKGFVSELVYDFIQDALSEQAQAPEDGSGNDSSGNGGSAGHGSSEYDTYETKEIPDSIFTPLDGDTARSVPEFEITRSDSAFYPAISADNTRGLYIGDTFYLAGDVSVIAFDMTNSYSRLGKLSLA